MTATPAPPERALTADEGQAGLEAVAAALQLELIIHLRVDVVQGGQRGAEGVAVVPPHQRQPPQEQALADLGWAHSVGLGPPGPPGAPRTPHPSPGLRYLLLHGTRGFGITQAGPAREGAKHRQHWEGGTGTGGSAGGWRGVTHPPTQPTLYLRCVLVSHRPPR